MVSKRVGQPRIARVSVTLDCPRKCPGCCNTYASIMKQARPVRVEEVAGYDQVIVTGGEPMLRLERTLELVNKFWEQNPGAKIYLYTAGFDPGDWASGYLVQVVDGVQYSIHAGASYHDVAMFARVQDFLRTRTWRAYTHRLFVDKAVARRIPIIPSVWSRIVVGPWMSEQELLAKCPDGAAPGEKLLSLGEREGDGTN